MDFHQTDTGAVMIPMRPTYWHIHPVWVFYFLAAVAALIFILGVAMRVNVWRKGIRNQGISFSSSGIRNILLDGLLGRVVRFDERHAIITQSNHQFLLSSLLPPLCVTILSSLIDVQRSCHRQLGKCSSRARSLEKAKEAQAAH